MSPFTRATPAKVVASNSGFFEPGIPVGTLPTFLGGFNFPTSGWVWFRNLDFVSTISLVINGSTKIADLKPREHASFRLSKMMPLIFAQASSGNPLLELAACDAVSDPIIFSPDLQTACAQYGSTANTVAPGTWQFRRPVVPVLSSLGPAALRTVQVYNDTDLAAALSGAQAGDWIMMNPGIYAPFVVPNAGTLAHPLVIAANPGTEGMVFVRATIDWYNTQKVAFPGGGNIGVIWLHGTGFDTIIYGLVVEGPRELPGVDVGLGGNNLVVTCVDISNGVGEGVIIAGCACYHGSHCGIKNDNSSASPPTFLGNVIFENGFTGNDHGIYVGYTGAVTKGNVCFNNSGYNIHSYGFNPVPTNQQLTYNLSFGNNYGFLMAGLTCLVQHNTVVNSSLAGMRYYQDYGGNTIKDNIFAFNALNTQIIQPEQGNPNVTDYNCYWTSQGDGGGAHSIVANPLFNNLALGDCRLQAGSPCIGKASDGGNMGCF